MITTTNYNTQKNISWFYSEQKIERGNRVPKYPNFI